MRRLFRQAAPSAAQSASASTGMHGHSTADASSGGLFGAFRSSVRRSAPSSPLATADRTNSASALAARLPGLVLQADHIAATLYAGQHGLRRSGGGETFWQYRQALPGEPASHIDWRQSARTLHAYVRETEAESPQTIFIWCDLSPSMAWRSSAALPEKLDSALLITLATAALLLRNGERVQLLTPSGPAILPPGGSPLERLALGLAQLAAAPEATRPALPPSTVLPRYAQLLIVSDFLCPEESFQTCLHHLAGRPVRTHLVQIADPAERTLPYQGRVRFEGLEGETEVDLPNVQTLQQDYVRLVDARNARLTTLATRYGHDLVLHSTDQPPMPTLLALHALLSGQFLSRQAVSNNTISGRTISGRSGSGQSVSGSGGVPS
ncbi:hypothetical protein AA0473_1210 [Acetobacter orleanensis NRIC 0473]|uniref:DUF58 domain-containing protein n=2 Tax=Acetobacter orleanensis TaxID=104099 RepID=A0A4Y3TG19_9PROT|nr:hypothetical protein Abol_003_052 [Acetobacter orleanensis JCM 7639]GBR26706.1 hypothetical protein AA0473_1210 [Acetobacter orleanensis NRIC 0473]GEB81861.1 hypothetical protein AOR01nite_03380 [Acetobacter orleanensis]